jgi:hypothetical protein
VHLSWIAIRLTKRGISLISKSSPWTANQSGNKVAEQAFEQAFSSVASKNPKQAQNRGLEAKHWRSFSVTASFETCLLQIMDTSLRVGDQRSAIIYKERSKGGILGLVPLREKNRPFRHGKKGNSLASDMTWAYQILCSSKYGSDSRPI